MKLPMMTTAKRYCELITDLKAESSRLCKTKMMRISWLPSADQTRL